MLDPVSAHIELIERNNVFREVVIHSILTMIIDYDTDDRCIRVDDVAVSHADAEKLMAEHETAVAALENALVQYERDHATTDNPDGHHD